jgi:hypothetical protein
VIGYHRLNEPENEQQYECPNRGINNGRDQARVEANTKAGGSNQLAINAPTTPMPMSAINLMIRRL